MKRITWNFDPATAQILDETEFNRVRNEEMSKTFPSGSKYFILYDKRNDVYCVNPTQDHLMYSNYLKYLSSQQSNWKSYGYFDAGMLPYIMWPSFAKDERGPVDMYNIASQLQIQLVSVPAVSLLKESYSSVIGKDYWIFREDFMNLVNAYEDATGCLGYKISNPESPECCLSKFVERVAEIEKATLR